MDREKILKAKWKRLLKEPTTNETIQEYRNDLESLKSNYDRSKLI